MNNDQINLIETIRGKCTKFPGVNEHKGKFGIGNFLSSRSVKSNTHGFGLEHFKSSASIAADLHAIQFTDRISTVLREIGVFKNINLDYFVN
jgi:hypothetical protein